MPSQPFDLRYPHVCCLGVWGAALPRGALANESVDLSAFELAHHRAHLTRCEQYLETKRLALFQYLSALLSMKDVTLSYEMARFVLERMDRGQRDFPTIVEELVLSVEGRTVGSRSHSAGSDLSETPGSSSVVPVSDSLGVEGKAFLDTVLCKRERWLRRIIHYFVPPTTQQERYPTTTSHPR